MEDYALGKSQVLQSLGRNGNNCSDLISIQNLNMKSGESDPNGSRNDVDRTFQVNSNINRSLDHALQNNSEYMQHIHEHNREHSSENNNTMMIKNMIKIDEGDAEEVKIEDNQFICNGGFDTNQPYSEVEATPKLEHVMQQSNSNNRIGLRNNQGVLDNKKLETIQEDLERDKLQSPPPGEEEK